MVMRSNYKKLGPYIREIDDRNTGLKVSLLLGVSVSKKFIFSIANTIGTDMSTYKVVKKGQFAYGPVTSRNSDKISIALLGENECIISSSYSVFEVIDVNDLLPEYLMMWFRRPEFDRYARFKSHGSVRELFDWEEMCDVELPIPPIGKQRQIVKEYNTVVDRITLNENLNQKLEKAAEALYRHWFVDFQFPISMEYAHQIGKPELEGKPYKSSGGELVYSEVVKQELPKFWSTTGLSGVADYLNGLAMQKYSSKSGQCLPVIKIRELNQGFTDSDSDMVRASIPEGYVIDNGDVLFSWSGSLMVKIWCGRPGGLNQHLFKVTSKRFHKWFYYLWTKKHLNNFKTIADGMKTSMGHIRRADLNKAHVIVPPETDLEKMDPLMDKIFHHFISIQSENIYLSNMRDLVLKHIATI